MKIAYLVNLYPTVSHTFIRREIQGIELGGHQVYRFSVRSPPTALPDPADQAERERTQVILAQRMGLAGAALRWLVTSPVRTWSAWRCSRAMVPRSARGIVIRAAYLVEACWLAKALQRNSIDHLHAHFGTNPAAVARLVGRLADIPYSFTAHGPDEFDEPRHIDLGGKIAEAKFAVAISHFGRSQLCRWAEIQHWPRLIVVRCGVDIAALDQLPATAETAFDFCTVARLTQQKGLPTLLDALKLLRERGVRPRVALIGDGPMRGELEAEIERSDLGGQVTLLGSLGGGEVLRQLRGAKALVLPSFAEGLPVVIMESLAVGTPVITTTVAGIPELVDSQCGWLVPPGEAALLADAMAIALAASDADRAKMGAVGAARVRRQHDSRNNAGDLLAAIAAASCLT